MAEKKRAAALPLLREADFRKALKGDLIGAYLFFGEEDYMKASSLRMARTSVCPPGDPMACFNDIRMDGLDFTPAALLDAMVVPPMGASRKVITVTGLDFRALRASEWENLYEVLSMMSDYPHTLLILSAGEDTLDVGNLPKRPSAQLTTLAEYVTLVYFERNTPAKLYGWVQKHYLHHGVQADAEVCRATVAWCGRNMYNLATEIEKVAFYCLAHGRKDVSQEDVRHVATPAMEYDAFAFANAIMEHRPSDALAILQDLKIRRTEPLYVLSEVSRVMLNLISVRALSDAGRTSADISEALKMHEYQVGLYLRQAQRVEPARLREAVQACQSADLSLKRSSMDGYGVLERLICSL